MKKNNENVVVQVATVSKTKKNNEKADIKNPNIGTDGVNIVSAKSQGNRGKQLNPNQIKAKKTS